MSDDERNVIVENEYSESIIEPRRPYKMTIEVPVFLTSLSISLSGVAVYNIFLYRTCVHTLNHSKEECKAFLLADKNESLDLEGEVQKYVTLISMVRMTIEAIVPTILSLFIGVWSDTHGRKPLVVWPLFGFMWSSMLFVVYSMIDGLGPWWMLGISMPLSLCGGYTMLLTGAYCYMSDITSKEKRSLRMLLLDGTYAGGTMVGSIMSAHLLKAVGNVYMLLIVAAINVFAYVHALLYIKESLPGAIKGDLSTVLNFRYVKQMVIECFKERPNNARAQILLLAFANTFVLFIGYGAYNLEYLYSRQKLHWAMSDYTLYSGLTTLIAFVGGFVGVAFLQKCIGVSDVVMVIVALVSSVADCLIKSLAVSTWHMYFASSISVMKGLSGSLIRSFLSKILPMEDTAKLFALLNVLDAVCPMLAPIVYSTLYSSTITTFPGAFYMLSASIYAVCSVLLGFVQYFRWKSSIPYQRVQEDL